MIMLLSTSEIGPFHHLNCNKFNCGISISLLSISYSMHRVKQGLRHAALEHVAFFEGSTLVYY